MCDININIDSLDWLFNSTWVDSMTIQTENVSDGIWVDGDPARRNVGGYHQCSMQIRARFDCLTKPYDIMYLTKIMPIFSSFFS